MRRDDRRVAKPQRDDARRRLRAWPLLDEHELAAVEIATGLAEQDHDLQRKHVLRRRDPGAGSCSRLRRSAAAAVSDGAGPAAWQRSQEMRRGAAGNALPFSRAARPSDSRAARARRRDPRAVSARAAAADTRKYWYSPRAEAMALHDDARAEALAIVVDRGELLRASSRDSRSRHDRDAVGVERSRRSHSTVAIGESALERWRLAPSEHRGHERAPRAAPRSRSISVRLRARPQR